MLTPIAAIPAISFRLPAMEAFPVSLAVLVLSDLNSELGLDVVERLLSIQESLDSEAHIEKALKARSSKVFRDSLTRSYKLSLGYFVESSLVVWRALGHDYDKLLCLSRASANALENKFAQKIEKLGHSVFIDTLTGVRVTSKVAEWAILMEREERDEGILSFDFLSKVSFVTFLTWVMLSYATSSVRRVPKKNVQVIGDAIKDYSEQIYREAIAKGLPGLVGENQEWYWSVEWQEGEVEADLDKRINNAEAFGSAEELINDLHR